MLLGVIDQEQNFRIYLRVDIWSILMNLVDHSEELPQCVDGTLQSGFPAGVFSVWKQRAVSWQRGQGEQAGTLRELARKVIDMSCRMGYY